VHEQARLTSEATTAVPQAMASRFTMPSGSYTDGQTNTVDAESSWRTSAVSSIRRTHTTPGRAAASSATAFSVSSAISGVSGAPAHSTICADGSISCAAATRWPTPFCRVIRPTNTTLGRSGSTPFAVTASRAGSGW
jgi:hypothetical protein